VSFQILIGRLANEYNIEVKEEQFSSESRNSNTNNNNWNSIRVPFYPLFKSLPKIHIIMIIEGNQQ
jgi:hypothetical protein